MKVRLERKEGKSHDLWQIEVDGATYTVTSGKVGAKKAPTPKSKTLKTADAATKAAEKEIAKKKAALYFDPSTIEGILEAHVEQLDMPTAESEKEQRAAFPHATEDYFRVYRTGALSIGFLQDFAPMATRVDGELGEMKALFVASRAQDTLLDEDAAALDAIFYVLGELPDGSAVVQYNNGKYAGRIGVIDQGPGDELVEHLVEGDPDATVDAWLENGLVDAITSKDTYYEAVRKLLLHHKGAAVDRLVALREAIATVEAAVAGDPLEVKELDLTEKGLRTLPAFLGRCTNLEVLKLGKNELDGVPPVLRKMTKLRALDLYYNRIDTSALPAWLSELPLTDLNLGINGGEGPLAPALFELAKLETLDLHEVEVLPAAIGALAALRKLYVYGVTERIEEGGLGRLVGLKSLLFHSLQAPLPADIGNLEALEVLKFVEGTDAPLPASIGKLGSLRTLHVHKSTLPEAVGELAALEELKATWTTNPLPATLGALSSLRSLDLSHAKGGALPATLGDLSNLEHLKLASARLATLPDSFARLTRLRDLDLATAAITATGDPVPVTELGDRLCGLENLETLALEWRSLATLRGSLKGLRNLKTLKIHATSKVVREAGKVEVVAKQLFGFVHDLPALTSLSIPSDYREHFEKTLPGVAIS